MEHGPKLSPRLSALAALVPRGCRLTDVGSDHAYLPVSLLLSGQISRAIATDIHQGPLERGRQTARRYGCLEKLSFRLCDGLAAVGPEETDCVVIAGMGGETMVGILAAAPWLSRRALPLLLQPASRGEVLRYWLKRRGWRITQELLAQEGERIYPLLSALPGTEPPLSPAQALVGRQGRETVSPLRLTYLRSTLDMIQRRLSGMERARRADPGTEKELRQIRAGLEEMIREAEAWLR